MSVAAPELSDELLDLGIAVGILRPAEGGAPDGITVNEEWFEDPDHYLSGILREPDQRRAVLELARRALDAGAAELDLRTVPADETWLPLAVSSDGRAGLYGVVRIVTTEHGQDVLLSLGGRVATADTAAEGLESACTVVVPLLRVSGSSDGDSPAAFLIGSTEGIVRIGASFTLEGGLGASSSVYLRGAGVDVAVPTDESNRPTVAVILRGLQLPGDPAPRDVTLSELDAIGPEALSVAVGLLAALADEAGPELRHLLTLLGIAPSGEIPPLPVAEVLRDGPDAFARWARALVSDPVAVRAWLEELGGLLGMTDAVTGAGTLADPYLVCPSGEQAACLTLRVEPDASTGATVVVPGVRVSAGASAGGPVPGRLLGEAEFVALRLGPVVSADPLPTLRLISELGEPGGASLVETTLPGPAGTSVPVRVGHLRVGLELVEGHRLAPTVEARDAEIGGNTYLVLDLSSAEAIADAAAGALAGIAQAVFEALEATPHGRALAALAGLSRPSGVSDQDPWPALPELAELFADPVRAIACYHARLFEPAGGSVPWGRMVAELGALIRSDATSTPASGTEDDPWSVALFDNTGSAEDVRGAVELLAWLRPAGPELVLAARLRPAAVDIAGKALTLTITSELARVMPPAVEECPGPVRTAWAARHTLAATLGEGLLFDAGPVSVLARWITGAVRWDRDDGIQTSLGIQEPGLRSEGRTAALPDLSLPFDGTAPSIPSAMFPWQQLELLFGQVLESFGGSGPRLAALLGWSPSIGDVRIEITSVPGFSVELPAGSLPHLPLDLLAVDPAAAVGDWLRSLTALGGDLPELTLPALAWLSAILSGASPVDGTLHAAVAGNGTYEDPWAVPVSASAGAAELVVWLDPSGPGLAGIPGLLDHLVPSQLTATVEEGGSLPAARLVEWLGRAAGLIPELRDALGDRADLAEALEALRERAADGDGLVRAAAQHVPADAPDASRWSASELGGAGHLREPARFDPDAQLGAGAPPAERRIFVSSPLPRASPWPGQEAAPPGRVVDLRAPGLAPEAFDLSAIASGDGSGSWYVLLPSRAVAGGLDGLVGRLRRTVDVIRERVGPGPLALIAHGTSGHAARLLAAEPGIAHLVTVGTPHGGATFEFLDRAQTADAIRLLQRLRGLVGDVISAGEDVAPLTEMLDTLTAAIDGYVSGADGAPAHMPLPVDDFSPPSFPPLHPDTESALAFAGRTRPQTFDAALTALVRRALEAAADRLPGWTTSPNGARPISDVGFGVRAPLLSGGGSPGSLSLGLSLRLDFASVAVRDDDRRPLPLPLLTLRAELRRVGGWLVGGPDPAHPAGTPRDPRVRWAEFVWQTSLDPLATSAAVRLHDASVFGAARPVWLIEPAIGQSSFSLSPEARVLLGEIAHALGAPPTAGPIRGFADVLVALGIAEVQADGLALISDAFERLLVDPVNELRSRLSSGAAGRAGLVAGLGAVLGATPMEEGDGGLVVPLGEALELVVRRGPPASIALRTTPPGLTLDPAVRVHGSMSLETSGRLRAQARAGPVGLQSPASAPVLSVTVDTGQREPVTVDLNDLALYPSPSSAELVSRGSMLLLGELLRAGLEWAHGTLPAVVDPFLDALALNRPGHVRNLAALLDDPGRWLADPNVLGRVSGDGPPSLDPVAVRRLLLAARGLLDPGGSSDRIRLVWGLQLEVQADGPDAVLALTWSPPAEANSTELRGSIHLSVGPGLAVTPSLVGAVGLGLTELPGFEALTIDLAIGRAATAGLRLRADGGDELLIPLLPTSPGLGALAGLTTEAVLHVLPFALDALAEVDGGLGEAIGTLGDALRLRSGASPRFVAEELRRLGADPAGEFRARLRADATGVLQALEGIADLALPPGGTVGTDTDTVTGVPFVSISVADLTVRLDVPGSAPPRLCVEAKHIEPIPGLALDARVCATSERLESMSLGAEVTSEDLLAVGGASIMPMVRVLVSGADPPGPDHRVEFGLWTSPSADPAERQGVIMKVPFAGASALVCRPADGGMDSEDLGECAALAMRRIVFPLGVGLVLSVPPVVARLEQLVAGSSLGQILTDAGILVRTAAGTGASYELDPAVLDPDRLRPRVIAIGARVVDALGDGFGSDALAPVTVELAHAEHEDQTVYGVRLGLSEPLEIFSGGGMRLRLETDASWIAEAPPPVEGVDLLLVSMPTGSLQPEDATLKPWIRLNGVGLRALGQDGGKLIDLVASVESIALHAVYRRNAAGSDEGVELAGGRLLLDRLAVPLGLATGENPVAAKLLSQGSEQTQAGDRQELAPAFSPQLTLLRRPPGVTELGFSAGEGDGPWWLAIQRRFGPLYVEQVGLDTVRVGGELDRIKALVDGGVSLAGLTLGVDDLSVSVPWRQPLDLDQWRLDLAGLAVGYEGGGISLAGGLRRRPGPDPDYVGLLLVKAGRFGLNGVAGYAEIPESPGSGRTYTSLFAFAALSFPLGGPPAFFVTGLGGGAGLNRRLVLPPEVTDVPRFPLVTAMEASSPLASDPMEALETLGSTFPPERGTFWFAAGVRFTSFVVVESVVVLSVEVADGPEVSLLGLSRMDLPNREFPLARVELALRGRFSTKEGVLAIQGQLTDNSWLISPDCRLTGGFAYALWFKGALNGQFVLSLGGYHPSFHRPAAFPVVPRLGFNWLASSKVTVKGEAYFALTSTCVMAGGRLEASYKTSVVWASFTAGVNAIVSWDPFFYDVTVYVGVSAGVDIEVCFIRCWRVRMSMTIGAEVHVFGPELRGTAKLDLDVTSVTVTFGPSGAINGNAPLGWNEFRAKYLVAGDPEGLTMGAGVAFGQLTPDPGAAQERGDTGKIDRPWRVVPEFAIVTETRAASNVVNGWTLDPITPTALDLGPMHQTGVVSSHRVRIRNRRTGEEVTGDLEFEPLVGNVPEGIWRKLPTSDAVPEARVRPAYVGGRLVARPMWPLEAINASLQQVQRSEHPHALPFADEQSDRDAFAPDTEQADRYVAAQPTDAGSALSLGREKLERGFAASPQSRLASGAFAADRVAPPRLAPLTEGMVDEIKARVEVVPDEPAAEPSPPDSRIAPPRIRAILRGSPPAEVRGPIATSVGAAATGLPRAVPPTLTGARAAAVSRGPAALTLTSPAAIATERTVLAADAGPPTRRTGGLTELRQGPWAAPEAAASMREFEDRFADGGDVPLTAGDLFVWELPNAHNDIAEERPTFLVDGDQLVRFVAIDRTGDVLADETGAAFEPTLPRGAHRVSFAGLGSPNGSAAPPSGLAGWHAATRLRQIADDVYLGPQTVVRSSSPSTIRGRRAVGAAVVLGALAVAGRGVVLTRLRPDTRSVAVVVQASEDVDETLAGLALGLEGATRRLGPDGRPEPPRIVLSGVRAHGVFSVEPSQGAPAVVVTVASDERWELAGVVGSVTGDLVAEIATRGLEEVLSEETASPLGRSQVRWRAPREVC